MKLEKWIDKEVKLIFQDSNKILIKKGLITEVTPNFVILSSEERTEAIPISRVVRIELIK